MEEEYEDSRLKFNSGVSISLDVFLPLFSLAFEYQGEQHFYDLYAMGEQWTYLKRDQEKRDACRYFHNI